jgi:pimeloyl-ACP methyl ester carboxylesterase
MKETPLLMGSNRTLFGICTEVETINRFGAIILNAGLLHHVGPYRLHVSLARALAEGGVPTIRIDQSGKGESSRRQGISREEALLTDFDDAHREMTNRGVDSIILIGLCSGADDALYIAQHRSSVRGLVLLDGFAAKTPRYFFNHYRQRIFKIGPWLRAIQRFIYRFKPGAKTQSSISITSIRDWSSTGEMLAGYKKYLQHKAQLLTIFTGGASQYYNYRGQLTDSLNQPTGIGNLEEIYYAEATHTYQLVAHRTKLIEDILVWTTSLEATRTLAPVIGKQNIYSGHA